MTRAAYGQTLLVVHHGPYLVSSRLILYSSFSPLRTCLQSGSISTDEMTNILTQLKIKMAAEQISTMMNEADPDGSGSVDFEEFCAVLTKQMESGGQLASVVDSASSFFGFLNPFNWFSSKPKEVTL